MPKTMHGKPVNEKAWERAKQIVREQYPKLEPGDRFYSLVTTIYKSVIKSPKYATEQLGERQGRGYTGHMSSLAERLGELIGEAMPDAFSREDRS